MRDSYDFLDRLDLDENADARAIRRAYARELKLIDQEREAARFQDLRAAYETALRWADHQAREHAAQEHQRAEALPVAPSVDADVGVVNIDADATLVNADGGMADADGALVAAGADAGGAPLPAPAQTRERLALEDPQLLASRAFDAFVAASVALTQGRMRNDVALWQDALRRRLDDDDLLNLSARLMFEGRVAHLLSSGWKVGHETLFAAACEVFQWTRDQRRLQQFGYVGAIVNAAVEERRMFDTQAAPERDTGQRILARLRKDADPDPDQLQRDMFYLQRMLARFPHYLKLVASADAVQRWQALYVDTPQARRGAAFTVDDAPPASQPALGANASFASKVAAAIVLLVVLIVALNWSVGRPHGERPTPPRAPQVSGADRAWPKLPSLIAPTPDYAPLLTRLTRQDNKTPALAQRRDLSRAQLDAIGARIRYLPLPGAPPGERRVDLDIRLDLDGNVSGVVKKKASMDIDYDTAVEAAIRKSAPFPAATPRHFAMWFSVAPAN
jgi:hypothetical protein